MLACLSVCRRQVARACLPLLAFLANESTGKVREAAGPLCLCVCGEGTDADVRVWHARVGEGERERETERGTAAAAAVVAVSDSFDRRASYRLFGHSSPLTAIADA